MKIINVTPGLIPIPPNGWGAVEKIIWEFHNNLSALGYESHIMYLDDIPSDADIVHIHVANLALMARDKGIPYYFTCHDHHAYLYGKESDAYKENLEAMKYAVKSFVPAKYLVNYFDGIPEYFSHGVNPLYFYPPTERKDHRLLCVANNGYAYDQTIDRKGFGIAIEAARVLGLPITIAGPSNNKKYFDKHPPTYDKLTILYDVSEDELRDLYKSHSIFVHPSELEAGHPNLTLLEAMASGLPVVGTFEAGAHLDGMVVTGRDVEEVTVGIQEIIQQYSKYTASARQQAERLSWHNRTQKLLRIYSHDRTTTMKQQLMQHYTQTEPRLRAPRHRINMNSIDGMFVEILGNTPKKYRVAFRNSKTGKEEYVSDIGNNCWTKSAIKYHVEWDIAVTDLSTEHTTHYALDLEGKRVYIAIDSKSLGDTLAWIPYVEEFRKKHKCHVICSTFMNELFSEGYPYVEFVSPGTTVNNIIAMYTIGLFFTENGEVDYFKNPRNPTHIPLQQVASDILGLDYAEIRPILQKKTPQREKQVAIGIHSTAQAKYWNNPMGWQQVVDWVISRGYTVKILSYEQDGYMGNRNPTGIIQHPQGPMQSVMDELEKSELFIGVSSGLSWLSWAMGTPTVMISGFTEPYNEMQDCIRISAPKGKCSGCWHRHKFNAGDWNWCPDHKGTFRQFECTREISSDMVIKELEKLL